MPPTLLPPLLVLLPLIGAAGLLVVPDPRGDGAMVRRSAMSWTLLTFAVSLLLIGAFRWGDAGAMQLVSSVPWIASFGLSFGFGVDAISVWLVLLTTFLMPLVVLGSWTAVNQRSREFHFWLLLLQAAMTGTFVATDLIFFYICFEFTLIPLYFLIGVFGSTQRLKAARVFFLYTFTGSMLTFAGVLYVAWQYAAQHSGVWSFDIAALVETARGLSPREQSWVLAALLAGFAVKVPLFPVHTWLPLAHTEAPTAGSVVLAGVLLKLGTYGLLRLAVPMVPQAVAAHAHLIAIFAVVGILYTALICWVQKDVKKLIAYSSVSHLGFCVLGMMALNPIGGVGSVAYMINHGLSTGALFLCVGMIYERFHTREISAMSGLARAMPVWSFFMVFFCLASVGLPGLNGFVGEFLCLLGAFAMPSRGAGALGPAYAVTAGVGMILGAIYLLYMLGKVVFGPTKIPAVHEDDHGGSGHSNSPSGAAPGTPGARGLSADGHHVDHGHHPRVRDLSFREIVTLAPLAVACVWLGVYPKPMLESLEPPVLALTQPALEIHQQRQIATAALPPLPPGEGRTARDASNAGMSVVDPSALTPTLSRGQRGPGAPIAHSTLGQGGER